MRIEANRPLWQPLTPGGVAALATAKPGRLLCMQLMTAVFVAGSLLWFLASAWFPVIEAAAGRLPSRAWISGRTLEWSGLVPVRLAGNRFLSITVDPGGTSSLRGTADIEVELGRHEVRIRSLLGYISWPYPGGYRIGLSRTEVQAWWGAWRHPLLVLVGGLAVVLLLSGWSLLAILYMTPIWFFGFYADRIGSVRVSWRLASAALLPGSVILVGTVILYGLQHIDLVGLLFGVALHLAIGWVYVLVAPFCLPRRPDSSRPIRGNPFRR